MRDVHGGDLFRLSQPGHRGLRVVPHAHGFELGSLLQVRAVQRRGLIEDVEVQPGRGVPDADQPIRIFERERLQQDAVYYAEDRRVAADPDRKSRHCDD
ncbi:MAG: hypothetical protein O2992_06310 [Gemmatimonadetes bacterium]|nr:hypothetical protein [Gemmatimonadota bacterium]